MSITDVKGKYPMSTNPYSTGTQNQNAIDASMQQAAQYNQQGQVHTFINTQAQQMQNVTHHSNGLFPLYAIKSQASPIKYELVRLGFEKVRIKVNEHNMITMFEFES